MRALPQWEFSIYALALPNGHGFGNRPPVGAWLSEDGLSCGILRHDLNDRSYGVLVMRRRTDQVWTVTAEREGYAAEKEALAQLPPLLKDGEPPEPVPPGVMQRPALYDLEGRTASEVFATAPQSVISVARLRMHLRARNARSAVGARASPSPHPLTSRGGRWTPWPPPWRGC